ncbi:MAG: ABC transporter permease/substrate-binding protein [Streptococcaceae bacterium]|nr:ABC transporter permease/substrate-binding protein [Streptococcaceae bacterium]MCL2681226.1 ABC transporter permease/substrate-binding protein [Streptococcaceae bacterium]MCL2858141.1 ABC transporter permease/substrate-binding protein [Streptococcaceae bacterium]
MTSFISTFQSQQSALWKSLFDHIQISLLSLFIAIIIGVPLALLLRRYKKIAEWILQITGIFQTIPSLALLGLLIPLIGIGTFPAVVALVIYALFPIIQNTFVGLQQIDPSLEEAAVAFGLNYRERLSKYELPLAMPFIIAGIRTSSVMIIGTATLAALIGAGGLGNFILLGINTNDTNLILLGAISSALLAIIFSGLLKLLEKAEIRTIITCFILTFILLLGSFYHPTNKQPQITIGGKLGSEPTLLINMYKDLIEQDTDVKVNIKPNFGDTTFLYNALKSDKIDMYPEYSGTILTTFLKENVTSTDPHQVYNMAREGIEKQEHFTYLAPTQFEDSYALAVKSNFAQSNHLNNISDLSTVNNLQAGFDLEFTHRQDGYLGLQKLYKLNFPVNTMQTSLIYTALTSDKVNLAQVYSTDSQIKQYNLKVLKDDKNLFPPYQAAPLFSDNLLKKYPQIKPALDKLSGKITNQEMIEMNYQVNVEQKDPDTVAHDFLVKEHLIH